MLTFVVDGWCTRFQVGGLSVGPNRPPILGLLALWVFVLVPLWFHIHTVRVAQSSLAPSDRNTLSEFFKAWVQQCAPGQTPVRPIIVAASGGATKAGLWAARVLYDIEQNAGGGAAVFAVSSVSGGSLGVAAYMALYSAQLQTSPPNPFCQRAAAPNRAAVLSLDLLAPPNSLYGDALGPILAAWLLADMPRAVFAWSRWFYSSDLRGGDSAEAIERAFDSRWAPIAAMVPGAPTFDQPFLSLFYKDKALRAGMPIWIANGTDATTGNRILTVPFSSSTRRDVWPFAAASDLLGLLKADVPISSAINNTARFPVLEPFGDLLPRSKNTAAEVIDGGYFENEGLQTALEVAEWLRTQGSQALKGTSPQQGCSSRNGTGMIAVSLLDLEKEG